MRAILSTLLILAATSSSAEWTKVTATTDSAYYVDPASMSNSGNLRRVWVIQDYAKQEPNGTRSWRMLLQIDCTGERLRRLAATEYSEAMAGGKILSSWDGESDWIYVAPMTGTNIPPRTPYRLILKFACYA